VSDLIELYAFGWLDGEGGGWSREGGGQARPTSSLIVVVDLSFAFELLSIVCDRGRCVGHCERRTAGWRVRLAAGLLQQVGQCQGRQHSQAGNAEHSSGVASVCVALADVGVVLLQDGGVAVLGLVLPAAPADHALLATHILVDLPAVVLSTIVFRTI